MCTECQGTVLDVITTHIHAHTHTILLYAPTHAQTLRYAQITFGSAYIIFAVHLWGWAVHVYVCVSISVCAKLLSVHWGSWSNYMADA